MKNRLNLRVYRRTFDHLILLWNVKNLTDDQKGHTDVYVQDKGQWRNMEYVLASAVEELLGEKVPIPDQTAMAGIVHGKNNLDPGQDCRFKVCLGKDEPVEALIQVYKVGVLPSNEKDRKEAHVQMMGWDCEAQTWTKVPLKKLSDGSYAIPIIMVKDE